MLNIVFLTLLTLLSIIITKLFSKYFLFLFNPNFVFSFSFSSSRWEVWRSTCDPTPARCLTSAPSATRASRSKNASAFTVERTPARSLTTATTALRPLPAAGSCSSTSGPTPATNLTRARPATSSSTRAAT